MGHTHTFRMKIDKLFCLCPEVPLQVCLPGSSNFWLSRTDRIQTEILCHFLSVPGLPYKREICVRFVWGLVPQEGCTEVLSYYPHIDKSIFHSFIFVLKNIPIVSFSWTLYRMKNYVPQMFEVQGFWTSSGRLQIIIIILKSQFFFLVQNC